MTHGIVEALVEGRLSRARVNTAARRVLRSKGYSTAQMACILR